MALRPAAFLETIIACLMPYFAGEATTQEARSEIIDTLASYATRTRSEMLQAAQIIALGMTTLDVLAEAKTAEMSPSMRLRYRGCANGLNRSTLGTEKALDQRLACELPAAPETMPELINDFPDAEVQTAVEHARAAIETHHDRLPGVCPAIGAGQTTQEERSKRLWAGAMIETLTQMGIPVQPGG